MDVETVSAVADQLSDIGGSVRNHGPVDLIADRHAPYVPVIQATSRTVPQANPKAG
ncbi:hypothetical protein [Mesorhizobium sp. M2C.T.Ca.TU.002.02.1.1]|uniref:hypothetical protein n=1 Tax=unclassified Mesorhizobium TaxID=325217 RepID=UPI000AFAF375|nr:hypothetical protein [Mesorhizobium sp. M2C.T.Ca.TU.002.02.1.1]